ncbi:uncharacterized protein LOC128461377 [Pleuronectes platessa]|uniref:uncharacterized protein LOC128461377 n=1 Tax=Pleuronectes platessa TaxID=8262 RepID=UPI00232A4B88|nr:uncharacterized protein LOC128461377 [Pleuronectes platessa]
MARKGELSCETRQTILVLRNEGCSMRAIAKKLKMSYNGVYYTLQRTAQTGSTQSRKRSGRPRCTTQQEDKYIKLVASLSNRRLTGPQLEASLNGTRKTPVSTSTVRRRLRDAGLLASGHSSSDEPLNKKKTNLAAEKPVIKANASRSQSTKKKADLEPLIKIAKTVKKPFSAPPKKSVATEKKASDPSSGDEPLIRRKTKKPGKKENICGIDYPLKRARKGELSCETRQTILVLRNEGCSMRAIAKKLKMSYNGVYYTLQRTAQTGSTQSRKRSGRPRCTTQQEDKYIRVFSLSNRRLTGPQLAASLNGTRKTPVSTSTVKRRLRDAGLLASDHSSDDEPLNKKKTNLAAEKPVKEANASRSQSTKKKAELISLVKKNHTDEERKTKTKSKTQRNTKKTSVSGSSSDGSDDDTITAAKHPEVTKPLKIILERCDGDNTGFKFI